MMRIGDDTQKRGLAALVAADGLLALLVFVGSNCGASAQDERRKGNGLSP